LLSIKFYEIFVFLKKQEKFSRFAVLVFFKSTITLSVKSKKDYKDYFENYFKYFLRLKKK